MDLILRKALAAARKGTGYAFATVIDSTPKGTPRKAGAKMLVLRDGTTVGTIGGGRNEQDVIRTCLEAVADGCPRIKVYNYFGREGQSVCGGRIKVFIEPYPPPDRLIICGAGHIALPLSLAARMVGLRVLIVDDRKTLANKKRFPHVQQILIGPHAEVLDGISIEANDFIMIVTQGNEHDYACLRAVVRSRARYIGVIASRAKRIKFLKALSREGVSGAKTTRVRMPAGIDIGAQTPEEIAISIIAEIISVRNAAWLRSAKFRAKEAQNL